MPLNAPDGLMRDIEEMVEPLKKIKGKLYTNSIVSIFSLTSWVCTLQNVTRPPEGMSQKEAIELMSQGQPLIAQVLDCCMRGIAASRGIQDIYAETPEGTQQMILILKEVQDDLEMLFKKQDEHVTRHFARMRGEE